MNWKGLIESKIESAYAVAGGLIDMVDDDSLDWKPATGSNWMTVGQLLRHLSDACGAPMKGFVTGDWGLPEGMDISDISPEDMLPDADTIPALSSVAEAREMLARDKELALEMLGQCDEERLAGEMVRAPWHTKEKNLGYHLLDMTAHLDKHAAQLFYYLKLQGKPVHTGHLWAG